MQGRFILFVLVFILSVLVSRSKENLKSNSVGEVTDVKDFKKILRTKNNVLVCFVNSQRQSANIIKTFKEAAEIVKGQGTMLIVDCSGDAKKMCKKLKVVPDPHVLKHYKDGEFHKVYDRKDSVASLVGFMRDPTGDIPWEEDETSSDVYHLPDLNSLLKLVRKESKAIMVMFYAPWCGFCKQLKPEYASAATILKNHSILAAIDVNRPENAAVRTKFNITGFPTLLYFLNGEMKFIYEGENKRDKLVEFMRNPSAVPLKPKDEDWSESDTGIVHLTTDTFDTFMQGESSTLVMFYAPWCGHCKKMKPEYEKAAARLKNDEIAGSLAAIDATREPNLAKRYNVKGYPTLKYFKDGEFAWDTPSLREVDKIYEFMLNPKEPPPPPPPEPEWSDQPSEVIHLDTDSFKHVLKKKKHVLVMFYAPWCGHCKMAKPEFVEAADEVKDNSRISFAALDCTKHMAVCRTVGINGYPTFKYYHYYNKNNELEYSGGRKKDDFLNFMYKVDGSGKTPSIEKSTQLPPPIPSTNMLTPGQDDKKQPTSVKTSTDTEASRVKNKQAPKPETENKPPPTSSKPPPSTPTPLRGKQESVTVKSSSDTSRSSASKSSQPSAKQDPDGKVPPPPRTPEKLKRGEAIHSDAKPTTVPETIKPRGDPMGTRTPTIKGKIEVEPVKKEPKVEPAKPPKSIWHGVKGADKVVHLTDSNYKQIITSAKSIMVMFYGSWCSSCGELAPHYAQAAMKIPTTEGILASCDGTSNPKIVDEFDVRTLPSLKYFQKGKYVADYLGKRYTEDILQFMKQPPKPPKQEL